MTAQQLNQALGLSIEQALKSLGREIDPVQIIGVLEFHKVAVVAHITALQQAQQKGQIIPFRRMPEKPNGERE